MLSLGVVIISQAQSASTSVTALLFGDVLGVTGDDIRSQLAATAVVLLLSIVFYRPFLALTFNPVKAKTLGMRPAMTQTLLLAMLALSIVASFQVIGTLLVFGLLVGPPATALLLARRVPVIMVVSMALGAIAVVLGLAVSFHHGTAGGATIAGFAILQFFIALAVVEIAQALRARQHSSAA